MPIKAALQRYKDASGLDQVQKGFCFDDAHDRLFALGWPHLRLLTDEPVDAYRMGMAMLRDTDFDLRITLPRELASGLLRAWAVGEIFITAPASREVRDEAQTALWNAQPFERAEISDMLSARLQERPPLWADRRATESMVLLAEALTETGWVAEAIVDTLERMDADELWSTAPTQSLITYQLGYLFLRMPAGQVAPLRMRLRDVLDGPAGLDRYDSPPPPTSPCHLRAMALVLNGALAAEAQTDHDLRWYTHVTDSPKTLLMRANINRGFTLPDARLVFLGGPELLDTRFGRFWANLSGTDQRWFVEQIGPVKAPQMVRLMTRLAMESPSVAQLARNWMVAHLDFAKPILTALAERSTPGARQLVDYVARQV